MSRLLKMFTRADFGAYEIMETYGIGARAVLIEEKTFAYSAFVKLPKSAIKAGRLGALQRERAEEIAFFRR